MEKPQEVPAPPPRRRRFWLWVLAGLVLATIVWLGSYKQTDFDLGSGRFRDVHYLAFLPVHTNVQDTALTRAFKEEDLRDSTADWRYCGFRGNFASNTGFRDAVTEIRLIEITWECGRFNQEAKRLMAKDVLALWKEKDSPHAARRFTQEVEALIESAAGREITAQDVLGAWRAAEAERLRGARPER
jgi:hypothetical protein